MNKISVIVPCYNEDCSLVQFHRATTSVLEKMNVAYELIYINDGSTDQTLSFLKKLAVSDAHINFISFSRNFGKEAAMYAGLSSITGNYAVIMDADLQHPPYLLKEMYQKLTTEGYHCVGAKRTSRDSNSRLRNHLSKCFYRFIDRLSPVPMADGVGDFRMMNQEFITALLELKEVNRYTKGMMNFVGFNCAVILYENVERVAGTSKWTLKNLFRYAIEGIVSFSTLPLILPFFFGALLGSIGGLMLIAQLICFFCHMALGPTFTLFASLFALFGILFGVLGIFGEYMAKMYQEIKNRPVYIIQESFFHHSLQAANEKKSSTRLNLVTHEKKAN